MYNKVYLNLILYLLAILPLAGQDCAIRISGTVLDEATNLPLSYVNVFLQEPGKSTTTDEAGLFYLEAVCKGEYHILLSHIGCEAEEIQIFLDRDTSLTIILEHTAISLEDIVVEAKRNNYDNQPSLSVSRQKIEENLNKTLSGLLENETGVHILKNGGGIGKPVVDGLFGNRLTILNNGIPQSGQQWGNDHSPEIDPSTADRITVLKGTNAIAYGSGNLGSVILIEPDKIDRETHLHGGVNYAYETNGRGNNVNVQLQKYSSILAWRVNGTLKKYGDRKTADYFLNNTGSQEANLSLQLEKSWNEKVFVDFYASTFNTQLGVLRGSHIGNTTDLSEALNRKIPFFTEPDFSYQLEAPKQKVFHHLAKLSAKYFKDETQSVEIIIAGQINDRKEFDVRRSGRTDIPALSLRQYTFNGDIKYRKRFSGLWSLEVGTQNVAIDNTNDPVTGIFPLIPDYFSWKSGIYSTLSKPINKLTLDLGIRYDYENQNVVTLNMDLSQPVRRFQNNFHNFGGVLGLKYRLSKNQSMTLSTGYATRNPAINELYSMGLHQGVSGIEEGDENLEMEKSVKTTLDYKWLPSTKFSLNALAYYQNINDYIFLNPQDEIRPTIRGAFPVFKYEQTDAIIYGLDISTQFSITNSLYGLLKYSFIRGMDTSNDIPLINIPPNSLFGSLTFRTKKSMRIAKIKLEQFEFELNNRFTFEQKNILEDQDFAAPPPAYNLLGIKFSTNIILPKNKIRFFTKVDNLLNVAYRDYLNRQRYFADDLGWSLTTGIHFKF